MAAKKAGLDSPEHAAAVAKFNGVEQKRAADANDAIAILERRVRTLTAEIELPGGDAVPIRSRLSREEQARYWQITADLAQAEQAHDTPEIERLSNALIGLILVVGDRTPDEVAAWLGANPGAISDLDAAEIIIRSRRLRLEDIARQKRLLDFREE